MATARPSPTHWTGAVTPPPCCRTTRTTAGSPRHGTSCVAQLPAAVGVDRSASHPRQGDRRVRSRRSPSTAPTSWSWSRVTCSRRPSGRSSTAAAPGACCGSTTSCARTAYPPGLLAAVGPVASYSPLDVAALTEQGVRPGTSRWPSTATWRSRARGCAATRSRSSARDIRAANARLLALRDAGLPVRAYGRDWSGHLVDRLRTWRWRRPDVPAERDLDRSRGLRGDGDAAATLNMHADQDGFTMRTFEACGVGGVQLIDRKDLGGLYDDGVELASWTSTERARRALRARPGRPRLGHRPAGAGSRPNAGRAHLRPPGRGPRGAVVLRHPRDLAAWQDWQEARSPIRRLAHRRAPCSTADGRVDRRRRAPPHAGRPRHPGPDQPAGPARAHPTPGGRPCLAHARSPPCPSRRPQRLPVDSHPGRRRRPRDAARGHHGGGRGALPASRRRRLCLVPPPRRRFRGRPARPADGVRATAGARLAAACLVVGRRGLLAGGARRRRDRRGRLAAAVGGRCGDHGGHRRPADLPGPAAQRRDRPGRDGALHGRLLPARTAALPTAPR